MALAVSSCDSRRHSTNRLSAKSLNSRSVFGHARITLMHFDEALQYLLSLGHETLAIKLGLTNTERLLEALGRPQDAFQKVQIAGTNGKGSTAVMLDAICRASRIRTGLYTSPHLVSITERIHINGQEITPEDFARLTARVRDTAHRLRDGRVIEALPTFFEHVTAIALIAFNMAGVELAILETGLGGRLDATTAACAETVAITPIALDHQEYLGQALADIAAEKAAIIRPGVTAVIAPQQPAALEVILRRAAACAVTPVLDECAVQIHGAEEGRFRVTFQTRQDRYENLLLGLRGRHQVTNATVAIGLAEALRKRGFSISRTAIIEGIESAKHPGRLEIRDRSRPRVLFDGAHNAAGARALRDYLDEFVRSPITLVFGAMRDKDLAEIARTLFPAAHQLILTGQDNPRAATPDMLARLVPDDLDPGRIMLAPTPAEAISIAHRVTAPDALICVTGSLYLVGATKSLLQ